MTTQEIQAAWTAATRSENFYVEFEKLTGFTSSEVVKLFSDWNKMSHEEVVKIAEDAGVTVSDAGFPAYLATIKCR